MRAGIGGLGRSLSMGLNATRAGGLEPAVRRGHRLVVAGGLVAVFAMAGAFFLTPGTATADTLVTLSGTITTGTTPAAGASVSFGGVSTTADLSGHYTLHPFSGTSGTIEINDGVVHASVPMTVGTTDQIENVNIPTGPATADVNVVDGDGDPLADIPVQGSVPVMPDTVSQGQTTDGTPLTWGFSPINPVLACTTDSNGTCSFSSLLGLTGTLSASVSSPYGSDPSYPSTFSTSVTTTVSSDPTSASLVIDWVHTIVALSGTVTIGSNPAAGAAVSFNGLTTTTDTNGNYVLHPFANSSGDLTVTQGPYNSTTSVTLGSTDQTQDVNIPSSGSLVTLSGTVTVGSTPAANARVSLGGLSTTTDANGNYVLQPIAGTSGTISVVDGVFAGYGYYASRAGHDRLGRPDRRHHHPLIAHDSHRPRGRPERQPARGHPGHRRPVELTLTGARYDLRRLEPHMGLRPDG